MIRSKSFLSSEILFITISVDQFFFPNSNAEKSTNRRQLDALLDGMSDTGIRIVTATAKEIAEVEKAED